MVNEYLNYSDFIKSQNKDGIFSHPDIQNALLMIMGKEKNKNLELSQDEEKKIAKNYQEMYMALAVIRWCRGEKLGVARQKSLDQMNNFVKSKTNVAHPMNKYLVGINGQMHREIAQINMMDANSDKTIKMNSDLIKKWSDEATKQFQKCLKELNDMYKKYMPEKDIKKMPASKQFDVAKQKTQQLMQQLMAQQFLRQRAA